MAWWLWLLFGFLLLAGEILTPGGFFLLFFGVGAILVGLADLAGIGGPAWMQWLGFSIFSIASLLIFRKPLMHRFSVPEAKNVDRIEGETALVMEEIPANGQGKAELRGAPWSARNIGVRTLSRGERVTVEKIDGLVLVVRGE